MPVVFRHKGFRFVFYSNEGDPREPAQIHAIKDGVDTRFWRRLKSLSLTMTASTLGPCAN
jgi:hypothetical protein